MKKQNIIWIGIGAALAAASAVLYFVNKSNGNERPPKKAPQLDLNHPGEQSDFPTSPSESEIG